MAGGAEIEKREKGFVAHLFFWVAVVFLLMALYVLSIGPITKMAYTPGVIPPRAFRVFYRPLFYVCERNKIAEDQMGWYLEKIWGVH